ncbi:hypothetical protein K1F50_04270 [Muricauda oceani]|uniref:Uncharacterized protein n=1 Tax=Flagellimonas oceani TaxID=2698672 RepID=A0A6G7J8Z7_9FLAO|nr:hypothetical protein [Allomuricauda oceani]MBW8242003.1 hypothetical protein [Allomuricauda oceani]QII46912.1 hypothetical protein GVT53_20250 [Allomuricauda oceani]
MKTSIIFKTMNFAFLVAGMLSIGTMSAQQTSGDVTKASDIVPGTTTTGGAIRVIDNRGTIKYIQTQNGVTMLSNTTDDVTTTTLQLGGTLTNDTFIDVDGNVFGLDGIELISTETPSTDATTASDHGTGTGYTILVRDEATGAVKKLLAADLSLVQSGQESFTATAGQTAYPLTGSPELPTFSQIWVYRNGVKLIANVDYTIATSTVTLVPGGTAPNDWAIYAGDIIEVQYVK